MKTFARSLSIGLIGFAAFLAFLAAAGDAAPAWANTNMFPPLGSAGSSIRFDGRGFIIHGKRTFICSGSLHYARVPARLWKNRLLKMKRAGFNTVQTYVFWNFQERQRGVFDWKGRANLNKFLKLVHHLGMYALVRCGPYDCAEWDSGGYPLWLQFIPGLKVRQNDPAFMTQVHAFWNRLLPIVARNQINRGGAVILVQLENEDASGWGTALPNGYFRNLLRIARANGIVVPTFFSGMHHGFDPAGHTPWNDATRISPWYTTEFWSSRTWYKGYGPMGNHEETQVNRGIWKIIAFGGAGYNFYMLVGGTNFGMWNDNEVAASYDYSAAIGQAGDLRPIYYQMKKANLFARSFQSVLSNSINTDKKYADFARGCRVLARSGPAGTIVFLDNPSWNLSTVTLQDGVHLNLQPRQIMPMVLGVKINRHFSITQSDCPILGTLRNGSTTSIVIYGPQGTPAHIVFSGAQRALLTGQLRHVAGRPHAFELPPSAMFPGRGKPVVSMASVGGERLRVIMETARAADHTWFVHSPDGPLVVEGPAYVGRISGSKGHLKMFCSAPVNIGGRPAMAWGKQNAAIQLQMLMFMTRRPAAPRLTHWQYKTLTLPAQPGFHDASWLKTKTPMPMGFDGAVSPWCWYRADVHVRRAGQYTISLSHFSNRAFAFVNGQSVLLHGNSLEVRLGAGNNTLAIFTAEYGRTKLYNYYSTIRTLLAKGLWGPVYVERPIGRAAAITHWRVKPMGNNVAVDKRMIEADRVGTSGWRNIKTGTDYFHGRAGFAWYRTTVPAAAGADQTLAFTDVDDNGWIFINGHLVASHRGWGKPFDAGTNRFWKHHSVNHIAVLVENISGAGGVMGTVTLHAYSYQQEVTPWRMRGGLASSYGGATWHAASNLPHTAMPRMYRATFNWVPNTQVGWHMVLRAAWGNLRRGHMYINGRDLGLYPDPFMAMGLYIPSAWMKRGENTLEMFDEYGQSPENSRLVIEKAASRLRWMLVQR